MSAIHFIGGEKGGVGKSVMARVLSQYLIDHQMPFKAYDSDKSHGALLRYYADYTSPITLTDYASVDAIVENIAEAPDTRAVVDLAAQTHSQLWQWLADSGVVELAQDLGVQLYYWHVMDASADSTRLLKKLLDDVAPTVKLVVVLNEIRGDQFGLLHQSGMRERADRQGAQFVQLRHLPDATMQKIDAHNASFWAAAHPNTGVPLGLLERQRLKVWLQRCDAAIAAVAP